MRIQAYENDLQMKLISAISIAILAVGSLFSTQGGFSFATNITSAEEQTEDAISDFEKAVQIIKKYETMHQPKHWPFVGYGHKVLPGEKFNRNKTLSESEADALLRKDLLKNCAQFRSFGADSLLLGVLAYNIGSGNVTFIGGQKAQRGKPRYLRELYCTFPLQRQGSLTDQATQRGRIRISFHKESKSKSPLSYAAERTRHDIACDNKRP